MTTHFDSKKLIVFDLDGTLAKSKQPMSKEMSDVFVELLKVKHVAVISGGFYPQFQIQLLNTLPASSEYFSKLLLMPTSGTRLYVWNGHWVQKYAEDLNPKEKERILEAFKISLRKAKLDNPEKVYGEMVEDRDSQITFSGCGQRAPLEVKQAWDPDRKKREMIAGFMKEQLPEFDVRIAGLTSVDITKRGVNKAYGIRKLEEYLQLEPDQISFVGDALFPGGNDYPARSTGVDCYQVSGPEETAKIISAWLSHKKEPTKMPEFVV